MAISRIITVATAFHLCGLKACTATRFNKRLKSTCLVLFCVFFWPYFSLKSFHRICQLSYIAKVLFTSTWLMETWPNLFLQYFKDSLEFYSKPGWKHCCCVCAPNPCLSPFFLCVLLSLFKWLMMLRLQRCTRAHSEKEYTHLISNMVSDQVGRAWCDEAYWGLKASCLHCIALTCSSFSQWVQSISSYMLRSSEHGSLCYSIAVLLCLIVKSPVKWK